MTTERKTRLSPEYGAAAEKTLAACAKWKAEHPDARLKFNPRTWLPKQARDYLDSQEALGLKGCVVAGLDLAIDGGVAGNSITRQMLRAIDDATPNGGASVLMAEVAIEMVYGIKNALTGRPA